MRETQEDVQRLTSLIESSNMSAGPFLGSAFEIPEKSLDAGQLTTRLRGAVTLVLGTVTSSGKPITAPVVALFYRAAFYIPTVQTALRTRHVRRNPAVSLSLYEGNDFAVIVHGRAVPVEPGSDAFAELVELQIQHDGSDVREWGDPLFLRVVADRLYSFARYPEQFPEHA